MEWFENWFDSPYYHILYKNRDYSEAEFFLNNLIAHLNPTPKSKMLDLACGKGRHSIFLANKNFKVTGLDLSKQSIQHAQNQSSGNPIFEVHDLRQPYLANSFDYVFNFFTSFGYFNNEQDNIDAINAINYTLKPNGTVVIDFFNANFVASKLVAEEVKVIDNIVFNITRTIENKRVIKHIHFKSENQEYNFKEQVQLLEKEDFEKYLSDADFTILNVFGDYALNIFEMNDSPRLIIEATKYVG